MTMVDGDITMNDETNDDVPTESPDAWQGLTFQAGESIGPDAEMLAPELPDEKEEQYDEPAADLLKEDRRKPNAVKYERKTRSLFKFALNMTLDPNNELKMADSAAIIMYAPDISEAVGDLAAENKSVQRAIDFLADDAVGNPALALTMAALPFALQIWRNHEAETVAEISTYRELKVPFTKRTIKVRLKFPKLKNRFARNSTVDPRALNAYVYSKPQIQEMLKLRGIDISEMR